MNVSNLVGKIFTFVTKNGEEIHFENNEGTYVLYHGQDCCEDVYIESIVGELQDLVDVPIRMADESTSNENPIGNPESFTWTFYKFATIKGYVDIRWYGNSNGYYSEDVQLKFVPKNEIKSWIRSHC